MDGLVGGLTYRGDFLAFAIDIVAEVFLYPAHCYDGVVA